MTLKCCRLKTATTQMRLTTVTGGGVPARPTDTPTATRHIGSMKQPGLAWVARQMRRQAESAAASECRPSRVLPLPPRSEARHCNVVGAEATEVSEEVRYVYRSGSPVCHNAPSEPKEEHSPVSHESRHGLHVRPFDDRLSGGQVDRVDFLSSGPSCPGYGNQRNGHVGSELASRVDMFGPMAPCWRLLESAQAYMDKDQLEYMRALILAQVRKPMSREQVLERAEGCLREQDTIFAAFVKMFDLIYRHPEVPVCPTKRPVYPCPQPASYMGRHSPGGYPIQGSHQGVPPSELPPRKGVNEQWEDSYLSHPVDERGQRGVPVILPCGCTGKWPPGGLATNLSHGC